MPEGSDPVGSPIVLHPVGTEKAGKDTDMEARHSGDEVLQNLGKERKARSSDDPVIDDGGIDAGADDQPGAENTVDDERVVLFHSKADRACQRAGTRPFSDYPDDELRRNVRESNWGRWTDILSEIVTPDLPKANEFSRGPLRVTTVSCEMIDGVGRGVLHHAINYANLSYLGGGCRNDGRGQEYLLCLMAPGYQDSLWRASLPVKQCYPPARRSTVP